MKYPLFTFILISLALTSCSLIRGVDTEAIQTPPETPEIVAPQEEVSTIIDGKTDTKPNTDSTSSTPENKSMSCSKNTDCQKSEICYFKPGGDKGSCIKSWDEEGKPNEEVSTEELTKELDAFVDDITKGL